MFLYMQTTNKQTNKTKKHNNKNTHAMLLRDVMLNHVKLHGDEICYILQKLITILSNWQKRRIRL